MSEENFRIVYFASAPKLTPKELARAKANCKFSLSLNESNASKVLCLKAANAPVECNLSDEGRCCGGQPTVLTAKEH
jgi:hypothetical protein